MTTERTAGTWDTEYCQKAGCQPTQIICPEASKAKYPIDSTHHLTPHTAGKGTQVMRCIFCGRTENEIKEQHDAH